MSKKTIKIVAVPLMIAQCIAPCREINCFLKIFINKKLQFLYSACTSFNLYIALCAFHLFKLKINIKYKKSVFGK